LGHILQAIRFVIKVKWTKGLRKLLAFRRVKQIIMSINDPQSYVDFLSALIELFFIKDADKKSAFAVP